MLNNTDYEEYAAQSGTNFRLAENGSDLELIEVTERKITDRQEMFSLIFRGAKDNFLPQQTYRISHAKLGDGELFLVPVGLEADGYRYEAGFNRSRQNE